MCVSYVHLIFLSMFLAPPDEKEVDGKIWIEFDDGDSGFFQLNEIKRIHPDFPVEGKLSSLIHLVQRPRQLKKNFEFFYQSYHQSVTLVERCTLELLETGGGKAL